ncbi:LysR family transcriptional regulator [Poseidonocella sp. HB161398]|uniref:LysR family transcriptional regulator n=1 Tax=Poseidonocella sp. HB161398 TaxID=2320855 RepID=UPI00110A04C3|nr:LysR family transcriptional regulator [Poseidonocella sp. HB161398]
MDRLTSMAVFVAAADLGSFAAAAAAAGISPQMAARHVVALEDRLGTRLLNRTTRKQSLTEFGRIYHARCKAILAELEETEALARDRQARPAGRLRVSAPVTFGSQSLVPLVTRYLRAHPGVEVDLSLTDRLADPTEEGFEAVIRIGPLADSGLIARPLAPYRLIACAAPAYLAANGTPQTPQDLAGHDCLGFAPWLGPAHRRWQFTRGGETVEVEVASRLRINYWKGLMQAALEGFGITLGPEAALRPEIAAGRLVRVLPDFDGPSRPMHVLYAPDRRMTPKLRSFLDAVSGAFPRPG